MDLDLHKKKLDAIVHKGVNYENHKRAASKND